MRGRLIMIIGAVGVTVVLAMAGQAHRLPGGVSLTSAAEHGRVDVGHGISISYPVGWHLITRRLTSVASPVQRLAVTSFPLRQRRPDPGCTPATALRAMPAGGAWLYLIEYTGRSRQPLASFSPRPARFQLSRSGYRHYECAGQSYLLRFRDAGRELQAQVYLGSRAGATMRAAVLSVLDSLHVAH